MAVSVRFHQEDPWERIRLVSAAMPRHAAGDDHHRDALHLLGAGRRGGDAALLPARACATGCAGCRSPTRPTTPSASQRIAAMAKAEGVEEVVIGLTYSISEVHTHQYYAERRRRAGRLPRHGRPLPQGPRRPAHRRRRARARRRRCAAPPASARSSSTATARSAWRPRSTSRASGPALTPCTRPPGRWVARHLAARGAQHGAQPRGRRLRAPARSRATGAWSPSTSPRSPRPRACRRARRASSTPPTTATSSPAGWSPPRGGCSPSCGGPSCLTRSWRR